MKRKSKHNSSVKIIVVLLIIILVCGAWLLWKNSSSSNTQEGQKTEQVEPQGEVAKEENVEHQKEEVNNDGEVKTSHLNELKEDEASFGKLEESVYKIDEKNIKIPLLIYHGFSTPMMSDDDDPYKLMCSMDLFEEQITTLKEAGYTFITLEDLYKYKNSKIGLPEKNITITMDDGWEGNYTEAFDIAKKYNVPMTIFIVEDLVGTAGYFSWEQAKEMYDSGLVKIHVHGRKHVSATGYTKEKLIEDYNHTHSMIEEKLGAKQQKIMAYPAGDSSPETIKWLKEAGFEVQVQTKYGTVNRSSSLDLTGLGRIRAEKTSGTSILKTINSK